MLLFFFDMSLNEMKAMLLTFIKDMRYQIVFIYLHSFYAISLETVSEEMEVNNSNYNQRAESIGFLILITT